MTSDAYDEFGAIDLSEDAGRQLDDIRRVDEALYGRIHQEILLRLTEWSPGDEDGEFIKHVSKLSAKCGGRGIYRLKSPQAIQKWRVFFTLLDGLRPAKRRVLAVVEFVDQQQCYDDMAQPHLKAIKRHVLDAGTRGYFKRRR